MEEAEICWGLGVVREGGQVRAWGDAGVSDPRLQAAAALSVLRTQFFLHPY